MLTTSNYVLLSDLTFINNSAGNTGGGLYLTNAITHVGIVGVTFIGNRAEAGSGGGLYVGPSCQYISLGGLVPIDETCPESLCPNDGKGTAPKGKNNDYLIYQLLADTGYQVKGYMVTFPITSDVVSKYCADWIKVNNNSYLHLNLHLHTH